MDVLFVPWLELLRRFVCGLRFPDYYNTWRVAGSGSRVARDAHISESRYGAPDFVVSLGCVDVGHPPVSPFGVKVAPPPPSKVCKVFEGETLGLDFGGGLLDFSRSGSATTPCVLGLALSSL